jgi:phenylacetate-coenzyme A ligase PaaK-like adenylate-forming protein
VREDLVLVETVPAEAGRYEIVLTVLGNPSFPLLRYAIGDVTETPLEFPPRGFAILKGVAGRRNDFLRTGTGRVLHPMRLEFLFGFDLAGVVRRYRIHQAADGAVSVAVEVSGPVPPSRAARLARELDDLMEGYPVALEIVPALPPAARKHQWTTSDLSPSAEPSPPVRGGHDPGAW